MSTTVNNDGNTAVAGSQNSQSQWLSFFQNNVPAMSAMMGQFASNMGASSNVQNGLANLGGHANTFTEQAKSWNKEDWANLGKKEKATNIMNASGAALGAVADFMPERDSLSGQYGNLSQSTESMVDMVGQMPGMVGAIYNVANGLSDIAAGAFGDTLTTSGNSKSDAIMDAIPLLGLANAGLGKAAGLQMENLDYDEEAWGTVGGSYAGSQSMVKDAADNTGGRYGILSKFTGEFAKDQAQNEKARRTQEIVSKIGDEAKVAQEVASSTLQEAILNERNRLAGNKLSLRVQKGMKLPTKEEIQITKKLLNEHKVIIPKCSPDYSILFKSGGVLEEKPIQVEEFKEGGKMNIIPEGELHARLHHMEQEGITKKGIPVISEEEGGEIVQHAEIERNEIIFRLEVTKKLEELMKDGSEESALEAGKLLADEILNNTEDRTGLLNEVQ